MQQLCTSARGLLLALVLGQEQSLRNRLEELFNPRGLQCRSLEVQHLPFLRYHKYCIITSHTFFDRFLFGDLSTRLLVRFAPDQNFQNSLGVRVPVYRVQPVVHVLERVFARHVIGDDDAVGTLVVARGNRPESLLSRSVPLSEVATESYYLKTGLLVSDGHGLDFLYVIVASLRVRSRSQWSSSSSACIVRPNRRREKKRGYAVADEETGLAHAGIAHGEHLEKSRPDDDLQRGLTCVYPPFPRSV